MFDFFYPLRLEIIREVLGIFLIYSILYYLVLIIVNQDLKKKLVGFDDSAKLTIALLGIFYLIIFPFDFYYFTLPLFKNFEISYPYLNWISFFIILFTQLFWFKKMRKNIVLRILVMFILTFSIEKYVILFTSLHRDYLPANWGGRFNLIDFGLKYLVLTLILILLSLMVYCLKIMSKRFK